MKTLVLAISLALFMGSGEGHVATAGDSSVTNSTAKDAQAQAREEAQWRSNYDRQIDAALAHAERLREQTLTTPPVDKQQSNKFDYEDYQRRKEAALAHGERLQEQALTNPPNREIPLPNFEPRAHLPKPLGINFYEKRDYYPGYLLCTYDVSENHYDSSNEPGWFESVLLQIRGKGRADFPPFKWVAVVIRNNADMQGPNTIDQAFKAGAIFSANDVFAPDAGLKKPVARAVVDHHPFQYDPNRPTPGEQDRWLIVERSMATNHVAASPAP